jgi:hypothetical protein
MTQGDANLAHVAPTSVTASASFPSQAAQVGLGAPMSQCPICGRNFCRPPERDRHLGTFLPHWLFCPFPRCGWRGDRSLNLKTHWKTTHATSGEAPKPEECRIYDPDPLVQSVVSGESPIESVITIALQEVQIRAHVLDKVGVWHDRWGRKRRVRH